MATQRERIGFIGLGSMGRPMATSLVRKGFDVTAFDTVSAHIAVLVERGAARAEQSRRARLGRGRRHYHVADTPDVAGVVNGPGGLLETGRAGMLMIDMSTIDPAASRSFGAVLADRAFVSSMPPSDARRRTPSAGKACSWSAPQAGDLERARPILEAMGNKIIHCGPQGSGISMKIVNNFLAMATCQISAEALTLGSKLGLSSGDHVRGDHDTRWRATTISRPIGRPRCSRATWTRVSRSILPTRTSQSG